MERKCIICKSVETEFIDDDFFTICSPCYPISADTENRSQCSDCLGKIDFDHIWFQLEEKPDNSLMNCFTCWSGNSDKFMRSLRGAIDSMKHGEEE